MTHRPFNAPGRASIAAVAISCAYLGYAYLSGALSARYLEPGATYALFGYICALAATLVGVWNSSIFRPKPLSLVDRR